jgi:serine phosphatase RsbU (regulator of sigma subunit)
MTAEGHDQLVQWGEAGSALEGVSGDMLVVAGFPGGVLVAVLDGLGHGVEAAAASRKASQLLQANAQEPVTVLVERCHEALRGTRGAVMTLASFDGRTSSMTWTGVGNVDAILLRADRDAKPPREALTVRGGVVGYQLPPLRASTLPVFPGDTLILATDGLRSAFTTGVEVPGTPQDVAKSILERFGRGTDDALVAVARYLGAS